MLLVAISIRSRCSSGWPNLSSLLRRQLIVLLISTAYHVPFSFCQNYSPGDLAKVDAACRQCDNSVIYTIAQYQNNFLGAIGGDQSANLTSLDIGRLYCEKFSKLFVCYQDCLHGYPVSYSSYIKSSLESFYNQFCDPGCLLAFLPGCFLEAGIPYDLYRSGCDPDQPALRSSISKCMNYWFDQQNCQGVCTKGQRAASGLKLSLERTCGVPEWNYECGTTLVQCMELSYGAYGADFIARDSLLNGIGSGSCSAYGKPFSSCLLQALNGVVTFGNPPFTVDYYQPCRDFADLVMHLISLSDSAVKPLCDNPQLNLSMICSPTISAVTIGPDSSTTGTRVSTSAADLQTISSLKYRLSTDLATASVSLSSSDTPESPTTTNPATIRQSETASPVALTTASNPANDPATSSSPATSSTVTTPEISPTTPLVTEAPAETYYTTVVDTQTTVSYPVTDTTTSGTPSTDRSVSTPTASHASPSSSGAQSSLSSAPPNSEPSATSDSTTTSLPATLSVPPALLSTLAVVVETVPSTPSSPTDTQTNASSPASIAEGFTTSATGSLSSLVATQPTINASPPTSVEASASAFPTTSYAVTNDAMVSPPVEPASTTNAESPTHSPALPETQPSSVVYSQTLVAGGTTTADTASATPADGKSTITATMLAVNESPTTVGGLPIVSSQKSDTGVTSATASGAGDGITPVTKAPTTKKPCKKRKR